jgi:hypothetical protein
MGMFMSYEIRENEKLKAGLSHYSSGVNIVHRIALNIQSTEDYYTSLDFEHKVYDPNPKTHNLLISPAHHLSSHLSPQPQIHHNNHIHCTLASRVNLISIRQTTIII